MGAKASEHSDCQILMYASDSRLITMITRSDSNSGQVMSASLLAICSTVPYLVVSLFGGAVADKMNKKLEEYHNDNFNAE